MGKLGEFLDHVKVIDPKYKDTLERLIKLEKKGRLRVVNTCGTCESYSEPWGDNIVQHGKSYGKCMKCMTAVHKDEYCSKWSKREE